MSTLKDFASLKSLRNTLQEQEQARAAAEAERGRRARAAAREADLFRHSIGKVAPLARRDPLAAPAPPAPLTPRQQELDDQAVLRESLSDLFEVDALMKEDPALSYTREGIGPDLVRKLHKRHWPIQDELDLHGLRRDDARDAIGQFVRRGAQRMLRCVRVIHGKGLGSRAGEPVLKSMVHSWLVQKDEVIAFCAARPSEGGDGALVVLLKPALLPPR